MATCPRGKTDNATPRDIKLPLDRYRPANGSDNIWSFWVGLFCGIVWI